jgi:hypothetical protein
MALRPQPDNHSPSTSGTIQLCLCVAALVLIWCVGLPTLAKFRPLREHIDAMEKGEVNVNAMFYTELNWDPPPGAVWR